MKLRAVIALSLALAASGADYIGAGSGRGGAQSAVDLMPAAHWYRGAATGNVLWMTWHETNGVAGTNYIQRDFSPLANDLRIGVLTSLAQEVEGVAQFDVGRYFYGPIQSYSGGLTIATWFYDQNTSTNSVSTIASDYGLTLGRGWYFGTYQRKARLYMGAHTNSGTQKLVESPLLQTGRWYHLVATWSGGAADAPALYVDGTNVGTVSINSYIGVPMVAWSNTMIGARNATAPDPCRRMMLDGLRIDRWAWTALDVTNDFSLTSGIQRP